LGLEKLIDAFLSKQGFVKCTVEFDECVKETQHNNMSIVCLYVDDSNLIGNMQIEIE